MAFRTKLDFSDNRQVKQHIETLTVLSGATSFGVPYNTLPTGINVKTTGMTGNQSGFGTTFSGNSGTTIFNWTYPDMQLGYSGLTAFTPSNSGVTQHTTGYTASTFVMVDGYPVATNVTGVTYDISVVSIYDLGGGSYSGTAHTSLLVYFSAHTINYTGRTIWVDVSGITRTQDLIVSKNPVVGSVFTCIDLEGKGSWIPASAATSGLWIAGTGLNSVMMNNGSNISSNNNSIAEGSQTIASGNSSHAEGNFSIAGGDYSHAEGQETQAIGINSHAQGYVTIANGGASHAGGTATQANGDFSYAGGVGSVANGQISFVHGNGSIANGNSTIVLGSGLTGRTDNTTYVARLNINTLSVYADNESATSAGLEIGTVYRTSRGQLMIRY